MSSIIKAVFKATIGLLVNKGRDKAAERLNEGDVTDQKFRVLIVREIDEIKSKLDGLARKDLLASISFFKEGIELLYHVFDKARSRSEYGEATAQAAAETGSAQAFSLSKQMRKLELTGLDESASRALVNAKKRFEEARRKATEAFNNEALELCDRVLAMQYRVMATILETVDNPEDAIATCRVCIEELHQVPAVIEYFKVEVEKGFKARFSKDERRRIISNVCHVNRAIYDVTQMVACRGEIMMLPLVDIGEEKVDPLRDRRVAQALKKQGMEHCFVPWSLGQEGEEEHKLKDPRGITTNSHGQFIIADDGDKTMKVFDSNGKFHLRFNLQTDDADTKLNILDVATDVESNTYVLVKLEKPGAKESEWEVQVFSETAGQLHKFPVRRGHLDRLTVSGSKVLVLSRSVVDVYEQSGEFVRSFGEGEIKWARDITAANDGRVMVMDMHLVDSSVHLFTVEGQQLYKFNINIEGDYYDRLSCHPASEHVVVAGRELLESLRLRVAVFTTSGEFVRRIQLDEEKAYSIRGITVTMEGHIAVVFSGKVIAV